MRPKADFEVPVALRANPKWGYVRCWHNRDLPHLLSPDPFTAALPTLDNEGRLSGGNETRSPRVLKVAL